MQIIKTYNGTPQSEMLSGGTFTSILWDDLLSSIKQVIRLRDDEVIDGLIISEDGIKIKLSRKKGRKAKS